MLVLMLVYAFASKGRQMEYLQACLQARHCWRLVTVY